MDSAFMNRLAASLAVEGVSVARFEFAYMAGRRTGGPKKPPPRADKLIGEFQTALQKAMTEAKGPLLIGSKAELDEVTLPSHVTLTYLEDGNHDFGPRGKSPATLDATSLRQRRRCGRLWISCRSKSRCHRSTSSCRGPSGPSRRMGGALMSKRPILRDSATRFLRMRSFCREIGHIRISVRPDLRFY